MNKEQHELGHLKVTICHHSALYLLLILSAGRVQGLDEGSGMADEHGVTRGAHDHAEHGEPDVRHSLRSLSAVTDAQHVTHGLEESVRVLDAPRVVLKHRADHRIIA